MKTNYHLKNFMIGILLFFAILALTLSHPKSVQAADSLPVPEEITAKKETESSIRIKWQACKNVDGYYIYRYNKKKGRYKKVKEVVGAKKRTWVDKKVKTGKLYQYKIASYKKKKRSRKSYVVSAMAYGREAKTVNVGDVDLEPSRCKMNICTDDKILADVDEDFSKSYYFGCPIVSDELVWSSSNPMIASVDEEGNVTTYEKEGTCEIRARAHNGVTGKVKLTVTNYARPKSFPYYDGSFSDINLMLTEYKENVLNIANYFTIHKKFGIHGTIKLDRQGNMTGYPNFPNIESIYSDAENIIKNFPYVVEIDYSIYGVEFWILYGEGCWGRIDYSIEDDFADVSTRLASHWVYMFFAPI